MSLSTNFTLATENKNLKLNNKILFIFPVLVSIANWASWPDNSNIKSVNVKENQYSNEHEFSLKSNSKNIIKD